jgi:lipopolysaccharide/colanic/teichoic acid biosynthesis glycosyltransferase
MKLGAAAKRGLDIAVAGVLLLLTAPLQAVVAIVVRCTLGAPVLFRQERPGRSGRLFVLTKFRTMRVGPGGVSSDEARMTVVGKWLRATSLDELPTLWNVLRGDMSLVGPRPLLEAYLDRYTPDQARRHEMRPGVTGLAQVSGRNNLPWERRLELDVAYVDRWSLWLDLTILARTIRLVLTRVGVSAPGVSTNVEFRGAGREGGGA